MMLLRDFDVTYVGSYSKQDQNQTLSGFPSKFSTFEAARRVRSPRRPPMAEMDFPEEVQALLKKVFQNL